MTRTRGLSAVIALALLVGGCDPVPSGGGTSPAIAEPTSAGPAATSGPPPATAGPPPATSAAPAALSCASVRSASVYARYNPYNLAGEDGLDLVDGVWTGPGGLSVAVQAPCAVGELVAGAGPAAVVAFLSMTAGTTGRYWAMASCRPDGGHVYCSPVLQLDDREPIESIAIADRRITLVYLTRTPDVPPVGLNIRRTAIYVWGGDTVHEVSHTDAGL